MIDEESKTKIEDYLSGRYSKVNKKGEGVPITNDINNSNDESRLKREVNSRISNLELKLNIRISERKRKILQFIGTINYTHKGITGDQLAKKFAYTSNYTKNLIYDLRKEKLIISTGKRIGHRMTYFLSNMQDFIPLKLLQSLKNCNGLFGECSRLDNDIIIILLKELKRTNGLYHNFRLQTRLSDKGLYEMLATDDSNEHKSLQWKLQSIINKVKTGSLILPRYRSATLDVSQNGMVEIFLSSTNNPYDLINVIGLSEFMADLGKVEAIFHSDLKSFSSIERFLYWKIVRLDFNKDIKSPRGYYQTSGTNILRVHYLSHLYQFYTKQLPEEGLIVRIEKMFSNHKPYPTIMEFISP